MASRNVVGLAPKGSGGGGRTVVGLAPAQSESGRRIVGLPPGAQVGKTKHRSFLGRVGHVVGQKAELAARDIKGIPGGVIDQANTAVVQPWKDVVTTGHVSKKTNKRIDTLIQDTADSTRHALEHPGADPFATALTVLPVLHGAGRVAETAERVDRNAPRTLRTGDTEVPLIPSRNAAGRIGQKVYDKALQRGLDKNPQGRVAAHAQKRIGGAISEEQRLQQRTRAVPAALLDKAALKISRGRTPGLRREKQAALELTSVNTAPEEAAAYHRAQAEKGVNPKRNRAVAALYQRVADKGYLTKDGNGNVTVDAEKFPQLAKVDARLADVQVRGDEILVEKGVRPAEALQTRVNAPGRVRAGGKYVAPTPARSGVESAAMRRERARLESLQRRLNTTLDREETHLAKQRGADLGPLSEADAKARLHELDQQYQALVQKVVPEVSPYGGKISKAEQLLRNTENAKVGTGKMRGASRRKTVGAEEFQLADEKLRSIAETHAGKPQVKKLAALIGERDRLRNALNARTEASFSNETPAPLPRAAAEAHASVPPASNPFRNRIVRLGHELEAQQQRVARMEGAAAARETPTGIVGGDTAAPGRGFVGYRPSEKRLGKAEASASRGPVIGVAKSPIDAKTFTGRSIEQGLVPKDVTGQASRHYRQILKFVNTDAHRRAVLETGSDVRRSNRDVLMRVPDEKAGKLDASIQQALGRETPNVDSAEELATAEGLDAAHRAFAEHLLPGLKDRFATDRSQEIGVAAPEGYLWVDRNALGDLARPPAGPRGRIAKSVDTVNSAVTAATVYFKVGHIGTRVLTNAATNIIQGSAGPRQIARSVNLWHALSETDKARSLAEAGQHGFSSLPHEGNNFVAVAAGKGAQWWAKHADAMFRFNSLRYEAAKAGYGTPEKFVEFLDHVESGGQGLPSHEWAKVSAAARRADREAISYDRLDDFEKRYITRAIWFYPWIKGSTMFTVRTAIEHPYKAGALGVAGQHGRERQERMLGETPSYEAGLIALTGGHSPLTTDFSTFSPFATAADVIEAPALPGSLAGFLNPAAGATGQFVYGLNRFGGASTSPYTDALLALGSPTPEQQLAEAYAARNADQSGRMFHKTPANVLARFLGGPAVPRRVNPSALAKAAARQKSGRR